MLATGEGNLVYLEVRGGMIEQKGHIKLDAEVSCVDVSSLSEDGESASLVAVGTWDMQVLPLFSYRTHVFHMRVIS